MENSPIVNLVMAMLAVNQWRLDQSAEIYEGLCREGLFCPDRIKSMVHIELHRALKAAGYRKADYVVDLMCDRLFDLANKLSGDGEKDFVALCAAGNQEQVRNFVMNIKGVGPRVFENFWLLQQS